MEIWDQQLANCKTNVDRALLARSAECHPVLLKTFCTIDLDITVVREAILNPKAELHWIESALERFPELDTKEFWKLKEDLKEIADIEDKSEKISGDRDQMILKHIFERDQLPDHASLHLGEEFSINNVKFKNPDIPWAKTKKFRIAMVMAPAWGVIFPPYNLAKLTSILRKFDYSTKVYDLNIESYRFLLARLKQDFWRSEKYFLWINRTNFNKYVLPYIKPMLDKAIDEIIAGKPKVIGFSIYQTNRLATEYMVNEIKRKAPNICLIAGGPEVASTGGEHTNLVLMPFNYLFLGEAEDSLLNFLEHFPKEYEMGKIIGSTESKLKLEDYPYADYSDYNLKNYKYGNGVSIETSRGCVAQCSFCAETYFWKFRSNVPERVVDEMEYQINKFNIQRFWFVDSLVNGNLKNFERLIDLIIERGLNISWNSYVRCDGRMTKEFLEKVAKSGCTSLSYGIESGSQKVLLDMRKKVEVWEIENNIRDSNQAKIHVHANWIIGFMTEEPIDNLHSMQLIANLRKNINAISPGFGAGPAGGSHSVTNWKEYNIAGDDMATDKTFLNTWYTNDFKNTILHRFIRIKFFHIWLEILETVGGSIIENGQRYPNIKSFYNFTAERKSCKSYVDYEEYVDLIRIKSGELEDTLINEHLTMCYALFRYFGKYTFDVEFSPAIDKDTFGSSLVNDYTASMKITVENDGSYDFSITHTFNHKALDPVNEHFFVNERNTRDYSFGKTYSNSGNFNDWIVDDKQTKETIHEQYRNKRKTITILPVDE